MFSREYTPESKKNVYVEFAGQKELGIDAEKALEALEAPTAIDKAKAFGPQIRKGYDEKLRLSSDCMLNQIWKQMNAISATNEVCEW